MIFRRTVTFKTVLVATLFFAQLTVPTQFLKSLRFQVLGNRSKWVISLAHADHVNAARLLVKTAT